MLKFPFKRANETVMSQKDLFVFFKSIEMFLKKSFNAFSFCSIKRRVTRTERGEIQ